jgi:hypothetical protein
VDPQEALAVFDRLSNPSSFPQHVKVHAKESEAIRRDHDVHGVKKWLPFFRPKDKNAPPKPAQTPDRATSNVFQRLTDPKNFTSSSKSKMPAYRDQPQPSASVSSTPVKKPGTFLSAFLI